jgi:hypothetical protein
VVGAEVKLQAFVATAPFALAAALVRGVGIYLGARLAARISGQEPRFTRWITFGLLPQAGVAIALVALLLADFAPWGRVIGTIVLGTIIVNQLVGPVLFRNAVIAAGESRAALERPDDTLDEPGVDGTVALD